VWPTRPSYREGAGRPPRIDLDVRSIGRSLVTVVITNLKSREIEDIMTEPMTVDLNIQNNAIIVRSVNDFDPIDAPLFPDPPSLVKGSDGIAVVHAGGKGRVRVTLAFDPPTPDNVEEQWEEVEETTFSVVDPDLFLDGSDGELTAPFRLPQPGRYAIRVSAKGIKRNFDSYTRADEEPRIYLELRIWPVVDAA